MTPAGGSRKGAGRPKLKQTGKRVNVYISSDNLEKWLEIPPRQRSEYINRLIRNDK